MLFPRSVLYFAKLRPLQVWSAGRGTQDQTFREYLEEVTVSVPQSHCFSNKCDTFDG